ncbi:MAG: molybdopterin-dependent oxidoreductase, partial [bacterium]|nr:molybdopterin-dependent oxidoreductase [bacterium]
PFDTGAYASSTTYISGMAAYKAALELKKKILDYAGKILEEDPENLYIKDGTVKSNKSKAFIKLEELGNYAFYQTHQTQLEATASHVSPVSPSPYAAHFAEVEVDTFTGVVKVINYLACVDCGTPINPKLAVAQAEGGIINGIGFALFEEMKFDAYGRMVNPSFTWYKILSTADLPDIKVILIPSYEPTGPYGAKSIGEININGPLPAISNAIKNAIGIRLKNAPFTPEKVLRAFSK